jgi:predicted dienelactone hydrolase
MRQHATARIQFPSVRLHPPSLARGFVASYGEMSRRSGVAAEEDNHSDASRVVGTGTGEALRQRGAAEVRIPVLVLGSEDNDFLPFAQHAGRYAALLPKASLVVLRSGEGHFVYLNPCTSDRKANNVPLCVDREGVDRSAVHGRLAPQVHAFLTRPA